MLILGLNAFHPDSAACALVDGKLVAAVAEERLGPRHKNFLFMRSDQSLDEYISGLPRNGPCENTLL